MIAAEDVAELLPEEQLRVAVIGAIRLWIGPDPDARGARRLLLLGRDEPLLAHALQHDEAALAGALQVRPRRKRRRALDEPRDERALGERQIVRRLAEQVLRHLLDAIRAGAEIDAVQVELENLRLGQAQFEQNRQYRFLRLASPRPCVGQEQGARELLGDGASALGHSPGAEVLDDGTREPEWIEAHVIVEAMVLDSNDCVADEGDMRSSAMSRRCSSIANHGRPSAV